MIARTALACFLLIAAAPAFAADPDEDVAMRRQIFSDIDAAFKKIAAISADAAADTQRKELQEAAQELAKLSGQPWGMFGQQTAITRLNTRAGSMIWADPAGFRAAQGKFTAATQTLYVDAAKIDNEKLKKSVEDMSAICTACHNTYMR